MFKGDLLNTSKTYNQLINMSTLKSEVKAIIDKMPEDSSIDDMMAELYFKSKVDEGLRQLANGEGIPHEEAKGRLKKWLN